MTEMAIVTSLAIHLSFMIYTESAIHSDNYNLKILLVEELFHIQVGCI